MCLASKPSLSLSIALKDTYLVGGKNSFFLMYADLLLRTKAPKLGTITQSFECKSLATSLKIPIK
jgi:hypothetical protein